MAIRPWTKIGPETPVGKKYFGKGIVHQRFRDPKGTEHEFYFYTLKPSVVVMAVTKDGLVLLVREFKQGSYEIQEGFVGGYNNPGENARKAARREVLEETGYKAGRIISLGHMWIVPRHSNGRVDLFLALDCEWSGKQKLDHNEDIKVIKIPLEQWIKRVMKGRTRESFSVMATMRALKHLGLKITV